MTIGQAAVAYLRARARRDHLCRATVRSIRTAVIDFATTVGEGRDVRQLRSRDLDRWLATLGHLAPSTRSVRLGHVRRFARWLHHSERCPVDFAADAPTIRRARQVTRDMTGEHVDAMLAHCRDEREALLVWLAYEAGLRCVEISRLAVDDYDPGARVLYVTGKAGHQREVPVEGPLRGAIDAYLAANGHGSGPLVRNAYRDPNCGVGPERVSGILGRLVRESGVKVRNGDGRSAHGLRAAAASDLYDRCRDVQVVASFLGHASVSTTALYLRRPQLETVRQAAAARWT